jgi:uncharacterized OB-fold protein
MAAYAKPLPLITPDNRVFWDAARRHELCLPHCRACGRPHYPPGPLCPFCFGTELEWRRLSGRGRISTWVVVHREWFASFREELPYAVVQVELDEGPRLTAGVVDLPNDALRVDLPVEVTFRDVTPEITLPLFRPRAK